MQTSQLLALLLFFIVAGSVAAPPPACTAGTVSCCISIFTEFRELWVDEMNLTSLVQGDFTDPAVNKFVQFAEPSANAVIGIKGFENREVYVGTFTMQCACDRPGCNWNFVSENESGNWNGMPSLVATTDSMSPGWYFNNRTAGLKQPVVTSNQNLATLTDTRCGIPSTAVRLQAVQPNLNQFWAFRRIVNGTGCTGTSSPVSASSLAPTKQPTLAPTGQPTLAPTKQPTLAPTGQPTLTPTKQPTLAPTGQPTGQPTLAPTGQPTLAPTGQPTLAPTGQPTLAPTGQPTLAPTGQPTLAPTGQPTLAPTGQPTLVPTGQPTLAPTAQPTLTPTGQPTEQPTLAPTSQPTEQPTLAPSGQPTLAPISQPTGQPTEQPTPAPTGQPTLAPTGQPTEQPTGVPTGQPTQAPTEQPTLAPTGAPTGQPTEQPTGTPTAQPTTDPTGQPALAPTGQPTEQPTLAPTGQPTEAPTGQPTLGPTLAPTSQPTTDPTGQPTLAPTGQPTEQPTLAPSGQPTEQPTEQPTLGPTLAPTSQPTLAPTGQPTIAPTGQPTLAPTKQPTLQPTLTPTTQPVAGSCTAGTVSCCISMFTEFRELWVNEADLTSLVQGDFTDPAINKFVQFTEPAFDAVIGIKGFENREVYVGTFTMQCACDRPGCNWNFVSENESGNWNGMPSLVATTDSMSPGWYFNNRTAGLKQPVVTSNQDLATLTDARCGNPSAAVRLQAVQPNLNQFWAFRRIVNGTGCTGTSSPVLAPTVLPTLAPTALPTVLPTGQPTPAPTKQPTLTPTKQPTLAPTKQPTSTPTKQPTLTPTKQPTLAPTQAPTKQPTLAPTQTPTLQPTLQPALTPTAHPVAADCTAGTVSCCISMFTEFRELWVNEADLTSLVQGDFTDPAINKFVQFTEPAFDAVIGIKGFENREVYVGTFTMQCACDRPGCNWNFVSENESGNWNGMPSLVATTDSMSPGWYFNNRTAGLKQPVVTSNQNLATLTDTRCGIPSTAVRLQAVQPNLNQFWTFRRIVNGTGCTGTKSPVSASSLAPTTQPTLAPTIQPTLAPTLAPTIQPTLAPTLQPTMTPTAQPTLIPTAQPTLAPSSQPTLAPTSQPTLAPTSQPTMAPTSQPTTAPTSQPTSQPTLAPTAQPTLTPTGQPTSEPTQDPTKMPTTLPTTSPISSVPTLSPTTSPISSVPTTSPTTSPTSSVPTTSPTTSPTSSVPTTSPTTSPTSSVPTTSPTTSPTSSVPTTSPTTSPTSSVPTTSPTTSPTSSVPTTSPTTSPTSSVPTTSPTTSPTSSVPTTSPTTSPTSSVPTTSPTTSPTSSVPTTSPTTSPTSSVPTTSPTTSPTSSVPTTSPTTSPTSSVPTTSPTTSPTSSVPTTSPTTSPTSSVPTTSPTTSPTSSVPTTSPTTSPTSSVPTTSPTTSPTSSVPTTSPTTSPTSSVPTTSPTTSPTSSVPTTSPTTSPTSSVPTTSPTTSPTSSVPTTSPTTSPTSSVPTTSPTTSPTSSVPTTSPTTSPTSSVPTTSPTTSPTSSVPTTSPTTSPTSSVPTTSPTTSPTSSVPTTSPTTSPTSSVPTTSPTTSPTSSVPTTSPTTSPTSSVPTSSPTTSPTSSMPTTSPTSSVPTSSPTTSPTGLPSSSPSGSPTSSPTCEKPAFVDIVWVLDSSGSIMDKNTAMKNVTDFIAEFATMVTLAEDRTRMGFLQYAGPTLTSTEYTTIGRNLNVTDSAATNVAEFVSVINSLVATGGTTNTAGAIDFVREYMFTAANKRPGSHRIVILLTDGNPSDINGDDTPPEPIDQANAAVASLRAEDDVIFVFIKMDDMSNYQEDFLEVETNYQYESTYATLGDLLNSPFLCFQISDAPTASPTAPTTFGPTTSPTTSPISSVPTTSPTALPSTAPTTSPISSVPTLSPTASPSSSVPTTSPTTLPTTSPASSAPTASPTSLPTRSPTCEKPAYVDIVWVLDSSSSVQGNNNAMKNVTDFIAEFSHTVTLSAEQTRMGFLQYAGPTLTSAEYTTIGRNLNVTDSAATNVAEFVNVVNSLVATGGTTNTAGAIDFVRDYMLTDANKRPGSHRIVILLTDGNPSGIDGDDAPPGPIDQANAAVASLREEDDVIFVFIKLDDMSNYKEHFLEVETNYLYESTYATLGDLLNSPFLCFQITDAPTTSPTVSPTSSAPTTSPSAAPTTSPSAAPTTSPTISPTVCIPGVVSCCFTLDNTFLELYVNERDVTALVTPFGQFANSSAPKFVQFTEPSEPSAVIAFKGFENNELTEAGIQLSCRSSRPGSAWNFVSSLSEGWRYVVSTTTSGDNLPIGWYSDTYSGLSKKAVTYSSNPRFKLNTDDCGAVLATDMLRAEQGTPPRRFWAMRKRVMSNTTNCGTSSPTLPTPQPTFVAPTVSPTIRPTTMRPTTLQPTTRGPTLHPTLQPTTLQPTSLQPTLQPTSRPTWPLDPSCQPGVVSCCISLYSELVQMYVDNVDVTHAIQGNLVNGTETKFVQFLEPAETAAIGILGFENNELLHGTLTMQCSCSRPGCNWNFNTEIESGLWKGMAALVYNTNSLSPGWYLNNRTAGLKQEVVLSTQPQATLDNEGGRCGNTIPAAARLKAVQNTSPPNRYYAFRRLVDGAGCAGTVSPTLEPTTLQPTLAPTTLQPTLEPTVMPTLEPTLQPTWEPTFQPTKQPVPCEAATVTCCFTMFEEVVQMFVDEVNLTSQILPQTGLSNVSIVKTVTFAEPQRNATIALMGSESNEIQYPYGQMRCLSTRTGSPWTFVMDDTFSSMFSDTVATMGIKWNSNTYKYAGQFTTMRMGVEYPAEQCGGPLLANSVVRPKQISPPTKYYVLRKFIDELRQC
ncbi:hypothetical protein BASA81_007085 [Batrachochytrium salamandrivorans]|nr:hypothetical protein BASA81_007085 [Batrachochytrium salamandrivorans]